MRQFLPVSPSSPPIGKPLHASGVERIRFYTFIGFLVLCLLGGGSARGDVLSLLYVRPAAVLCIVALLVLPGRTDWRAIRVPLLLLAALALVMAAQLIPLPPGMWSGLPGHERFLAAAQLAGLPQPWRPISISPGMTLNSLASLVVPAAALIGVASLSREQRYALLPFLIGAALLSAFLGVAQLAGGENSAWRYYRITNESAPVGLFANRNHQAVLLAMAIPMLALWTFLQRGDQRAGRTSLWIGFPAILFLLPMILVTGSRAGLFLATIALFAAFYFFRSDRQRKEGRRSGRWRWLARYGPWIACAVVLLITILLARAAAVQRLVEIDVFAENRVKLLPDIIAVARDFLPFGSGFGAFDQTFRIVEPFSALRPQYLNHAHNDPVEILVEGGLFAAGLAALFLAWFARHLVRLFRSRGSQSRAVRFGQLGALMILLLLAASLVDYPIRTPIMASLMAIACFWLCVAQEQFRDQPERSGASTG